MIVEQVSRKTLDAEEVSYVVRLPDKKLSCASLDSLDVEVFISLDVLKVRLIDDATRAVNDMIASASDLRKNAFGDDNNGADAPLQPVDSDGISENISVDLGDGVKANFNIGSLT
tara:strand:- start:304 stop:648 length:345 start_codon:yes stop_codon:yes gene_type:complete